MKNGLLKSKIGNTSWNLELFLSLDTYYGRMTQPLFGKVTLEKEQTKALATDQPPTPEPEALFHQRLKLQDKPENHCDIIGKPEILLVVCPKVDSLQHMISLLMSPQPPREVGEQLSLDSRNET